MTRICIACATLIFAGLAGCNNAQGGAAAGAGVGALAGQAIGRNTESTLIGAGVGAAAGYLIGNEADKQNAQEQDAQMQRELDELRRRNRRAEQEARERDRRDRAGDAEPVEEPPVVVQRERDADSRWVFQGTGDSEQAAIREARSRARRALYDRVESWSDRTRARGRESFPLRNSGAFSSHLSLASDAMLESWNPDIEVRRRSDGRYVATVKIDAEALKNRYREYVSEAATHVERDRRDAFREWCWTMRL